MLEALAAQAGEHGGLAVTLFFGGGVLTGTLIDLAQWEHLWLEAIATTQPRLADGLRKGLAANRAEGAASSGQEADSFLHMKDATLITGKATRPVELWRGRASAVTGWTLGRYT
ncbi:hypothetical protein [Spirillospora sp. NPDC047279]|uniref:hypothetical protein n=1 Tax=Spirillospora sp. NPDC047279 TaxID=3155478 RepID=UPI0033C562D7